MTRQIGRAFTLLAMLLSTVGFFWPARAAVLPAPKRTWGDRYLLITGFVLLGVVFSLLLPNSKPRVFESPGPVPTAEPA